MEVRRYCVNIVFDSFTIDLKILLQTFGLPSDLSLLLPIAPPPYELTVRPSHDSSCMQLFAVGLKGPGGGDVRVISLDGVDVVGRWFGGGGHVLVGVDESWGGYRFDSENEFGAGNTPSRQAVKPSCENDSFSNDECDSLFGMLEDGGELSE